MAHSIDDHEEIALAAITTTIFGNVARIMSALAFAADLKGSGLAHITDNLCNPGTSAIAIVFGHGPIGYDVMPWDTDLAREWIRSQM